MEILPNEILLHIFSYLEWFDMLTSFWSLNIRFNSLVCSIFSINDNRLNSGLLITHGLSYNKCCSILFPLILNSSPLSSSIQRIHFDGSNSIASDLCYEWLFNDKKLLHFPNLKSLVLGQCGSIKPIVQSLSYLVQHQLDELILTFNKHIPKLRCFSLKTFINNDSNIIYLKWLLNNINYVEKLQLQLRSDKLIETSRQNILKSFIDASFIRQYCLPDTISNLIYFDFYICSECQLSFNDVEKITNSFKIHSFFIDHQWTNVKCLFDPIMSSQHLFSSFNNTSQISDNFIDYSYIFNWPRTGDIWFKMYPSLYFFLEQFTELSPNISCVKIPDDLRMNALNTVRYAEFGLPSCHIGRSDVIHIGKHLVPFLSTYMPHLQTLRLWRSDDFPWTTINFGHDQSTDTVEKRYTSTFSIILNKNSTSSSTKTKNLSTDEVKSIDLNQDCFSSGSDNNNICSSSISIIPNQNSTSSLTRSDDLSTGTKMYKANLAPKPYASPAQCGIDQPDTLENTAKKEKKNFKKLSKRQKQIEKICEILNLSETELLNCKHSTHITRTCRAVTKRLYPDIDTQVKKCLKSLPPEQIRAIIEYAKLVHPCQRQTSITKLKNTIGN
ncbi:unnamed protein product, partial [Rotaria sordida]